MRIAVLDDYQGVALDCADWGDLAEHVTVFHDTVTGPALVERLRDFEVICAMRERTPFPAELLHALPRLKLLVTTGPRNVSIDLAAAARCGVTVCGTAGRGAPTAQLTMALMLWGMRRLGPEVASMREGGWQVGLGRDLDGLRLGLVGLGRLGGMVAGMARAFGMEVQAWSANLTDDRCAEVGVERAKSLESLLESSDVVSLHLVLSARTRGLIGAAELGRMRRDSLLVNTSRGPLVDWRALLDGLRAGHPGAAALDVFDEEPLPDWHPLRDKDLIDKGKLLLTPHLGYVGRQTYELFYGETVEAIRAYLAGAPVRVLAAPEG